MAELAPGRQFAGYVIEGMLARGGMGVVYRARQLRPSRIVALKVISPELAVDQEFRSRFEHESEIAASIEHSNVIPVYETGEQAGLLYIVMRFVQGTDLRAVIAGEGSLPPRRAARILADLTAALDAAHARGLVHRDVKPANVLIAHEGGREHVYLTDFGLAKLSASDGRTRTGMFVGTLDYAAPEQFDGRRVDARTDVYAAGCVLYQMLTGKVPFPRRADGEIMWAHMSAPPPSVREAVPILPVELDAVIARAMAKDPDDRYPSAGDLGRDAEAAAEGQRATLAERTVATGHAAPVESLRAGKPESRLEATKPESRLGATKPDSRPRAADPATKPRAADPATKPRATDPATKPRAADPATKPRAADPATKPRATDRAITRPASEPPRRRWWPWAITAAVVVIVAGAIAAAVAAGGSGNHPAPAKLSQRKSSPAPAPAPTTKAYTNSSLGISFSYPAGWEALTLKGTAADFGINPGPSETRCALVFEPGAGPASSSQEARFAFVRARSAQAANTSNSYQLLAIQAQQGANVTGVSLLRVNAGQGGDLGFFFRGRDVFVFDCITPAPELNEVDQRDFGPLFATVRFG